MPEYVVTNRINRMRTLRSIFRRKLRAGLTIFGIVIGVFALVVMGALSEKMTLLVNGGVTYYKDKVIVNDKGAGGAVSLLGGSPISVNLVKEVEKVKGVRRASAGITVLVKDMGTVNFGTPDMIAGTDLRGVGYETETKTVEGRQLNSNDRGVAVMGSDIAKNMKGKVGKTIKLRGENFKVIGILEKTLTQPDNMIYVSMADGQRLFKKTMPSALQSQVKENKLATQITAYVNKGEDPNKVAELVNKEVKNVKATGPKEFQKQVVNSVAIFSQIIFAIGLISLVVGGLSVVNTMTMSVSERTREIGIRKAIGASDGQIIRQFLLESGTIGVIGGLIGLGLGWLFVLAINSGGGSTASTPLFLITARLAIGSVLFAFALGIISGLYPAWHAARMNPVKALRYE